MKANVGRKVERKQPFEEKKARLAQVDGVKLKCDPEHRRSGWSTAENKAACFECGNTDRFKAQCPIWIKKKQKWEGGKPTTNAKGDGPKGQKGKGKGKSAHFACLEDEELGPENEEIPANEVNYDCRYINLANILGARDWGRKNRAKECSSVIGAGFNG